MKKVIALMLLGISVIIMLVHHYLVNDDESKILSFVTVISFMVGLLLIIPFEQIPNFIFDPREWEENKTVKEIVYKLRIRAVLFNNISIAIFFVILIVILTGFYLLINPFPLRKADEAINISENFALSTSLTIRIASSVLLIFLVGILFRVFKYLLRVAAFYNSKADALEFHEIKPEMDLEKVMDLFTPDKYDISELEQVSLTASIAEMIKPKLTK